MKVGWEGASLIEAAMAHGSGVLFLTPHLGCFEITAQAVAQRFGDRMTTTVLFRPSRQPWLRDLVAHSRERPGLLTAPTTLAGVKQLIKALKTGQAVGLLPDQVPPAGQGVWAPFFGRDVYTMTLLPKLAQQTGALVHRLAFAEETFDHPPGRFGAQLVLHLHGFQDHQRIPGTHRVAGVDEPLHELGLQGRAHGGHARIVAIERSPAVMRATPGRIKVSGEPVPQTRPRCHPRRWC